MEFYLIYIIIILAANSLFFRENGKKALSIQSGLFGLLYLDQSR